MPCTSLPCPWPFSQRRNGVSRRAVVLADRAVRREAAVRRQLPVVRGIGRAVDDPVVRRVDLRRGAARGASRGPAFIHARASVPPRLWPTMSTCFACVYFRTERTNASRSGMFAKRRVRGARAVRRVGEQVALVALVAEPPDLARRVAVVDEVLRQRVDVAVRVARRSGTACRCCRAARSPASACTRPAAPKPRTGCAERRVRGNGEAGRERRADGSGGALRRRPSRARKRGRQGRALRGSQASEPLSPES